MSEKKALTFNDVNIKQRFSMLSSRSETTLSQKLGPYTINLPLISANMNAVTNKEFAVELAKLGGVACLPRFATPEENAKEFRFVHDQGYACLVSFGAFKNVNDTEYKRLEALYHSGARVFVLDVAHGAQKIVADSYAVAKKAFPDAFFLVGNFASNEAMEDFCHYIHVTYPELKEHCVPDGFKLGVGPGCLAKGTRILMSNGHYKNIEDVTVGEQVINMNGQPVTVIAALSQGKKEVLSYKNHGFYKKTLVTENHAHLVEYKNACEWIPTGAINDTKLTMPEFVNFDLAVGLDNFESGFLLGAFMRCGYFTTTGVAFFSANSSFLTELEMVVKSFNVGSVELANNILTVNSQQLKERCQQSRLLQSSSSFLHGKLMGLLAGQTVDDAASRLFSEDHEQLSVLHFLTTGKWLNFSGHFSLGEERYTVETFDLEVDCPTASFIANNAVVHNSACSTRIKTGVGMPQWQAVTDATKELVPGLQKFYGKSPLIISDGGKKIPGDISKALGAGAHFVMLGSMLAGVQESPGDLYYRDEKGNYQTVSSKKDQTKHESQLYKKYYGSASAEAYKQQGKNQDYITAEGESFFIPYKGPLAGVVQDIAGGVRSAFTYVGAATMEEFRQKVIFVEITSAGYIEGTPHGKK